MQLTEDFATAVLRSDMRFSAVWLDPRLVQEKNVAVVQGDSVVAPFAWVPRFVASGINVTHEGTFYERPEHGIVRAQYSVTGEIPTADVSASGLVVIKLTLRCARSTEESVQLWHPRRFSEKMVADGLPEAFDLKDRWSCLTDHDCADGFITPEVFTRNFINASDYRLCNRHAAKTGAVKHDGTSQRPELVLSGLLPDLLHLYK